MNILLGQVVYKAIDEMSELESRVSGPMTPPRNSPEAPDPDIPASNVPLRLLENPVVQF